MAGQGKVGSLAENFRLAIDLHDAGVEMMRLTLRRRFPEESAEGIDERLAAWMRTRPGAEWGDVAGRPRAAPESEKTR